MMPDEAQPGSGARKMRPQTRTRKGEEMARFTPEQAAAGFELEQFVSAYFYELDVNGGRNVGDFWFEDGVFTAGTAVDIKGLTGIKKFYADRNELVKTEQAGGVRTSRHTSMNNRITFDGAERATLKLTANNYSS